VRTSVYFRLLAAVALAAIAFAGTVLFLQPARAETSLDVVINEVAWMGTLASSYDEWIELHNPTDEAIDLGGWTLTDGNDVSIALSGVIPAGGYFLLERTDDTTIADIPADQIYVGNLSNSGEQLVLRDAEGRVIDTADGRGGWPAGNATARASMERIDPTAPDAPANWATNNGLTCNGRDAAGNPIRGTPRARNASYALPGLYLVKEGPPAVSAGLTLTCRLLLGNSGNLTATGVVLTDTLPPGLAFVAQTSTLPFSRPLTSTLRWDVGDLPPGALHAITLTLRAAADLSGAVTNVATATEQAGRIETAAWSAAVVPYVRLYALEPVNYGGGGEAAALINPGAAPASLGGWRLNDDPGAGGVRFPLTATIAPGQVIWLAQNGAGFAAVWGTDADWAAGAGQPLLEGAWPGFTDGGEAAYLFDDGGRLVDVLAYGSGSAALGWNGPAVAYPYSGYSAGQVLYRKLDQRDGLPVPDTDTAADWAQDPLDPIDGRRLRYPGWDLEALFFPAVATPTVPVTLAVAPDGSFELVSRTLAAAQESIWIEGYTFESAALSQVISDRLRAGVVVTMLLEGGPMGGVSKTELWIARAIDSHPNGAVYFLHGATARYRYQHAKFAVIDGRVALVSTENLSAGGMPSDRKDNGTLGHRGFVVATESPEAVERLMIILGYDLDVAHHSDLIPYGVAPFVLDDPAFTPLPEPDWTTYSAPFTAALATTATHMAVLHAPENSLRSIDGLLGLIGRAAAGDAVWMVQMSEPYTWTAGAGDAGLNPRLQALLAAARRGAAVRVLLDDFYNADLTAQNPTACRTLNRVAAREGLDLLCHLVSPAGLGIHAKVLLARVGDERWVHLGSINGSETASKANREVALQFRSPAAFERMLAVFEHDWAGSHGPFDYRYILPLVMRDATPPASYPLISEVLVNPSGVDEGREWIELYNPGATVSLAGWTIGDALNIGDYGDGRYRFPSGARLAQGQVMIVAACASQFAAAYGFNPAYEWTSCDPRVPDLAAAGSWNGFGMALGNAGDEVILLDAAGRQVDSVAWGGSARAGVLPYPLDPGDTFPSGASLERAPAYSDRDDCARDFRVRYTPRPGEVWAP